MDNSLKGLILASGVIITCIVISLGFMISKEAKNASNNGLSQISELTLANQDIGKTIYDGVKVSGQEVVSFIDKYQNDIQNEKLVVTVYTGLNNIGGIKFVKDVSSTANAKDHTNSDYINPNGRFLGEVLVDANGVLYGMNFTQV